MTRTQRDLRKCGDRMKSMKLYTDDEYENMVGLVQNALCEVENMEEDYRTVLVLDCLRRLRNVITGEEAE